MALVLDGATGAKIASFATGSGTDATGWDEKNQLAFISNGEGNITVIHEKSPAEFEGMAPIVTQASAKTSCFGAKRLAPARVRSAPAGAAFWSSCPFALPR